MKGTYFSRLVSCQILFYFFVSDELVLCQAVERVLSALPSPSPDVLNDV